MRVLVPLSAVTSICGTTSVRSPHRHAARDDRDRLWNCGCKTRPSDRDHNLCKWQPCGEHRRYARWAEANGLPVPRRLAPNGRVLQA
jgi:hypothetical protein